MHLSPKIHKRLNDAPGRSVISNCVTQRKNFLNFWIITFNLLWRQGNLTGNFLEKFKSLGNIPINAILVTSDVVGLYPSIPHEVGLQTLYEKLEERANKKIPSTDLVKMAEFILKKNFFEFETKIIQQISVTAIGTKFAPHMRVYLWIE